MGMITGCTLCKILLDAGIISPECRRVIIDVSIDEIVTLYIENYGDKRLLEINWGKVAAEIVEKASPQHPEPPANVPITWGGTL